MASWTILMMENVFVMKTMMIMTMMVLAMARMVKITARMMAMALDGQEEETKKNCRMNRIAPCIACVACLMSYDLQLTRFYVSD